MPKIEIDEAEFQRLDGIRATVAKIAALPEGKRLIQKAHKLVDPNALTPDLDAEEAKANQNTEWQKKFEDLETKLQADKEKRDGDAALAAANARWEAGRRALRESGWTPQGIEGVEKLMQEKGIADHEVAAAYIEKTQGPSEIVTPRAFGGFDWLEPPKEGDEFLKSLLDNRGEADGAVLKAASDAIRDVRGTNRR
jgi:hypothetical protein